MLSIPFWVAKVDKCSNGYKEVQGELEDFEVWAAHGRGCWQRAFPCAGLSQNSELPLDLVLRMERTQGQRSEISVDGHVQMRSLPVVSSNLFSAHHEGEMAGTLTRNLSCIGQQCK